MLRSISLVVLACAMSAGDSASAAPTGSADTFAGYPVAIADGRRLVTTPVGTVVVGPAIDADQAATVLPALVAAATAGGCAAGDGDFTLERALLVPWRMRRGDVVVIAEGSLRRAVTPAFDAAQRLTVLASAASALADRLPDTLSPAGAQGLRRLLGRLAATDQAGAPERGAPPTLLRRMIAAGWLSRALPGTDVATVEAACRAVLAPVAIERFTGTGGEIARWAAADGGSWWTLRTPRASALLSDQPDPEYWPDPTARRRLRVGLPAGADPLRPSDAELAAAELILDAEGQIVRWSAAAGWQADERRWREVMGAVRGVPDLLPSSLPPHLVVVDGDGRTRLLVTAHGALRPSRDAADAGRFMADAARILPDAAHLHLIGQRLFTYVFDSPDPRLADLPSDDDVHGDIHQTAVATVGAAVDGICRGDCDDLAEVYQAILTAQGCHPIVISLPRHAACAWAEQADGTWTVRLLQTGPALAFSAARLPDALTALWRHFAPEVPFDPEQLGLSLRFAGENTRTHWRLGWRIFAEPDYAATMIAVQRDWYFRTFGHAITVMRAMVEAGDTDVANLTELAGLYRSVGDFDEALRWMDRAMPSMSPRQALMRRAEKVRLLGSAGRGAEAAALAGEIDTALSAESARMGPAAATLALSVAAALDRDAALMKARLVQHQVLPAIAASRERLVAARTARARDRELTLLRQLGGGMAGVAMEVWQRQGADLDDPAVQVTLRAMRAWLDGPLFTLAEDRDQRDAAMASMAWCYGAAMGQSAWSDLVAALPPSAGEDPEPSERIGGLAQMRIDLPAIRRTPAWWQHEVVADLWGRETRLRERTMQRSWDPSWLDRARLDLHLRRLDEAMALRRAAGHVASTDGPAMDGLRLQAAMVTGDAAGVRAALAQVAMRNDRREIEGASQILAWYAEAWDAAGWDRILDAWQETVDSKPYWLGIAWSAAVSGKRAQALACAQRAARRYADDPLIADEATHMARVLAARGSATAATPP